MRTVFVASLRTHLRRYVAAAVAVTVAVAFVVVIGLLTAGARAGLMDGFGAPFRNADHVVSGMGTAGTIALADRLGPNASPIGRAELLMRVDGGVLPGTVVGPIATTPELRWQTLTAGHFPTGLGEAVVDVWVAQSREIAVGDRVRIGEGATAAEIDVVGIVRAPSTPGQASVYVTWPQLLHWRDQLDANAVAVRGDVGELPDGATVQSPEEYVNKRRTSVNNGVDALSVLLLVFAGIALFVSALVIANTFAVLFAQRLRDFALLRCVGATRRQVVRSVRREAVAVGVLASLAGILVGVGLGYGLIALINALAPAAPMGAAGLPARWLLGGFVVGVVVTMVASWLPTRRVTRVSPLAALRPDATVDVDTKTGTTPASVLLVTGLVLLAVAMSRNSTAFMLAGGGSAFVGVLLFGPVLVPRLIRILGAPLGPTGRLATANAVRNPRRTATTTASLLVGVTLTTAVLTGLATTRAGVEGKRGTQHPVDAALTAAGKPVTTDLVDRARRVPGVERAIAVTGAMAEVTGLDRPVPVVAAPEADEVARDGGAFARVEPGQIRFDRTAYAKVEAGDRVTVRVGDRRAELRVVVGTGWGSAVVVAPGTLASLTDAPEPLAVWIRASAGADATTLVGRLDDLADPAGANVTNQLQAWESEQQELRTLTWLVLGLLSVAVVIAVVGIANTLGLSVLERAREHAMLRALGLTRRQLRRMLAAEAVLLSVVATLLGTVIGVGFAWVGYETFATRALSDATMRVPWLSLGVVVLVAGLAGLLASVLPARRAARVTPAAGLSLD
ncbi:ABC transporter permease [Virgisporangium aurantiacum]|uniref:ABC transporter permease n=1 Tax=Virgisporangium aurantiacum TaxID=175570 RepID=A0A8J3ZGT1_9ACTN|nr:FtsX family ABC transporter permease [Virgisporangium aurantiacum]GIJ63889.1 ABC transporter permease [Virgisporangium aurantiacum]